MAKLNKKPLRLICFLSEAEMQEVLDACDILETDSKTYLYKKLLDKYSNSDLEVAKSYIETMKRIRSEKKND